MMYASIALNIPLRQTYYYTIPTGQNVSVGSRVKVSFGRKRETIGIVLSTTSSINYPATKLKPIIEILDDLPVITPAILKLCQWASNYYQHPIGEVLFNALPLFLRQGKPAQIKATKRGKKEISYARTTPLVLNEAQQKAVDAVVHSNNQFQPFLLNGVTGSGKTEVYLQIIETLLKQDKQCLVLVPEISLTPQTITRFRQRFDQKTVCFHSRMTNRERLNAWLQTKSGEAKIVIGTRSSIFMPFQNLGAIIIDEEHDLSFKQQEGFRYSARDLGIIRAQFADIPILLGSATPSFESLHNATRERYQTLELPERAGSAIHPTYELIDIRDQYLSHGLSQKLLVEIAAKLDAGEQIMLFLNRRGYSPTLMCHSCGYVAQCKHCDVRLTLHNRPKRLHCHHCDFKMPVLTSCPMCQSKDIGSVGVGTERLEEALQKAFPTYPVLRIDRDTTQKKDALQKLLDQINQGTPQILIGTQMVAKGHHFPNVTLVGIINADSGFFSADFRGVERIAQLLIQVSGRAGRAQKPGKVLIQTFHPEHPLLITLLKQGYLAFAELALKERQEAMLPPYCYFALIRAEAIDQQKPFNFLTQIKSLAEQPSYRHLSVLGPIPSPIQRKKNHFRAHLLVQSSNRVTLQQSLKQLISEIESKLGDKNKIRWSIDVDPAEMG